MKYYLAFLIAFLACLTVTAQDWKLIKDKNGIKVYSAIRENSRFKSIRVECVFEGTIPKLVSIMKNVSGHPDWVYKTQKAYLIKEVSANEIIYYSEVDMPWPVTNRDGVYHLKIYNDTAHILRMFANAEPAYIPKTKGIIRVPYTKSDWYVTEANNRLTIDYFYEVDPGGSLPAWIVNMFADKGPYESFQKLSMLLKSK